MLNEIPLQHGQQYFSIILNKINYNFIIKWNGTAYTLDINNSKNVPILNGILLVCSDDLLVNHKHLNLGGRLYIVNDLGTEDPGYIDLGVTSHLCFEEDV